MAIIVHVLIALTSVIYAGFTFFQPSGKKLNVSYILVAATIATGTYLVIMKPSHMVSSCITGLAYLAVVFALIISARHKLAKKVSE